MNIPNLFIVGAPKCGTTSLFKYLEQVDEVYASKNKEPFFFAKDMTKKNRITKDEYLKLFEGGEEHKYRMEGTTWYLFSKTAADEIYKYSPEAKIIIMLRNPIDLLYSLFYQRKFNGNENCSNLLEALEIEPERRLGKKLPVGVEIPKEKYYYSEVVRFVPQLKRYIERFGKENICIIQYEDFQNDTAKEFKRVLSFLKIRLETLPSFKSFNSSKINKHPGLRRTLSNDQSFVRKIGSILLPQNLRSKLYQKYLVISTKKMKRPELSAKTRQLLIKKFKKDIQELSDVLNRDLSHWTNE